MLKLSSFWRARTWAHRYPLMVRMPSRSMSRITLVVASLHLERWVRTWVASSSPSSPQRPDVITDTTSLSRDGSTTESSLLVAPEDASDPRVVQKGADTTLGGGGDKWEVGATGAVLVVVVRRALEPPAASDGCCCCWFLLRPVLGMAEQMRASSRSTLSVRGTLSATMSCWSMAISCPRMEDEKASLSVLLAAGSEYWKVLREPFPLPRDTTTPSSLIRICHTLLTMLWTATDSSCEEDSPPPPSSLPFSWEGGRRSDAMKLEGNCLARNTRRSNTLLHTAIPAWGWIWIFVLPPPPPFPVVSNWNTRALEPSAALMDMLSQWGHCPVPCGCGVGTVGVLLIIRCTPPPETLAGVTGGGGGMVSWGMGQV